MICLLSLNLHEKHDLFTISYLIHKPTLPTKSIQPEDSYLLASRTCDDEPSTSYYRFFHAQLID